MRAQQSTAVLLSGPNGCGKRSAAEAIGYETGRPLKVMNYSKLMANSSGRRVSVTGLCLPNSSRLTTAPICTGIVLHLPP